MSGSFPRIYVRKISSEHAPDLDRDFLQKIVKVTFEHLNLSLKGKIGIIFIDNSEMIELNKRYFNKDVPTDVMAFTYKKSDMELNGEIIISLEEAKKQAKYYKNTYEEEVSFLIIHGILHLLGWDDKGKRDREMMLRKQREILSLLA